MRVLGHRDLDAVLRKGDSARRDAGASARFKPGDAVIARNLHPSGHTRLPRYARSKRGVVVIDHGLFVFPDSHAATGDPKPQHCYAVRFAARELWGEHGGGRDSVIVDLFDDYLDPA